MHREARTSETGTKELQLCSLNSFRISVVGRLQAQFVGWIETALPARPEKTLALLASVRLLRVVFRCGEWSCHVDRFALEGDCRQNRRHGHQGQRSAVPAVGTAGTAPFQELRKMYPQFQLGVSFCGRELRSRPRCECMGSSKHSLPPTLAPLQGCMLLKGFATAE